MQSADQRVFNKNYNLHTEKKYIRNQVLCSVLNRVLEYGSAQDVLNINITSTQVGLPILLYLLVNTNSYFNIVLKCYVLTTETCQEMINPKNDNKQAKYKDCKVNKNI